MINSSLFSSKSDDWETPQKLFDNLNKNFGFTLDVCANEHNHKCDKYFSIEQNGLVQPWIGRCWMNPPYGRQISLWVQKAYIESRKSNCQCVCLLPVRSDTKWWHNYIMYSDEIWFLSKRLKFGNSINNAPFPSCIVIFSNMYNIPHIKSYSI